MAKSRFRDVKKGKLKEISKSNNSSNAELLHSKKGDYIKAFLTDNFMLLMPIMYIVFYFIMGSREDFRDNMLLGWIYILVPLIIIESIFLIKTGQTPGMKAYKIKLTSNISATKPPIITIIFRQILAKITFFIFGWISIFISKKNRNLHDIILNTALVYEDRK